VFAGANKGAPLRQHSIWMDICAWQASAGVCLRGEPMSRHSSASGKPATDHTAIIGDVPAMWSKLRWDAEVFRDFQVTYADEAEPLAYAAINVCIAASGLKDWAKRAVPRKERDTFDEDLATAVPLQAMCEAIANTYKHSAHSDGRWGGSVSLEWEEADEWGPEGYVLRYIGPDGRGGLGGGIAANQFRELLSDWWTFLLSKKLVAPDQGTPAWLQRKILKNFPALETLVSKGAQT